MNYPFRKLYKHSSLCRLALSFVLIFNTLSINTCQVLANTPSIANTSALQFTFPHILFLHSYYQGSPWTDAFHQAAIDTLNGAKRSIVYRTEYLDAKNQSDTLYMPIISNILSARYQKYSFDAVIVSDDAAFQLVTTETPDLLKNVPIIFGGVDSFPKGIKHPGGITGVEDEPSIKETLEVALKLHPGTKEIIILTDSVTVSGKILKDHAEQAVNQLVSQPKITYWEDVNYDIIEQRKNGIDDKTVLLWIGMIKNTNGIIPDFREQSTFLSKTLPIPIYSCWSHSIGYGFVGGKIVDSATQGRIAAELAIQVLDGKKADSLEIVKAKNANKYQFDYNQLKRFGIKKSQLPKDSTIINLPENSVTIKKGYLLALALFFLALSTIIILLFALLRMKKISTLRLKESEEQYRRLYEEAPVMLYTVDMNRKIIAVNNRLLSILGYRHEEVLGRALTDFLADNSQGKAKELFLEMQRKGSLRDVEYQYVCKDGSVIDALLTAFMETDVNGKQISARVAIIDITESNKIKKEKAKLESQLYQAQKMEAIGTLVGGIAHDFNNILSSIFGFAELAKNVTTDNIKAQKRLDHVLVAGTRAKELVQHLLTFSRKSSVDRQVVNLIPLLKESIKFIKATAPSTVTIESYIEGDRSNVLADVTQMHQVFMNLFTNAVYAMKESGGLLKVSIEHTTVNENDSLISKNLAPGKYIRVIVSDTGKGIAPNLIDKIFDPFFTTKANGEGTGLGLSVVYGIIQEMKGDIRVYSNEGEGTTFNLFLPEITQGDEIKSAGNVEQVVTGEGTILLVDDEEEIILWMAEMLKEMGYTVISSRKPKSALKILKDSPEQFDLVLTDLTMPKMLGTELAEEIHAIRNDLPIILCTGFNEGLDSTTTERLGIRTVLMKPVISTQLSQTIKKYIKN